MAPGDNIGADCGLASSIPIKFLKCRHFQPVGRSKGACEIALKMLAFTDFHGNKEAFEKAGELIRNDSCDCVVVAGDVANYSIEVAKQRLVELGKAMVPLFFVPGNMDSPELASWSGTSLVRPLHGRSARVAGIFLAGLGGSPPGPFSTPFQIEEEEAARLMNEATTGLANEALVLVSHCPPKNTKVDIVPSGEHAGSIAVRNFIEMFKPAVVISGHIHEAKGIDSIGQTTIVNTGPAQRGDYAEITLERRVTIKLGKFS